MIYNYIYIITIIISCTLLVFLNKVYDAKVKDSNKAEEARAIRKQYSRLFLSFLLIFSIILLISLFKSTIDSLLKWGLLSIWMFVLKKISLPISTLGPENIKKKKKFILYLRGFDFDEYTNLNTLSKEAYETKKQYQAFSEYHFFKYLSLYFPVITVGMTKELLAPAGATRIYLNDNEWEVEVKRLIEEAEMIFILVNDSNSCIWEIDNSFKLDKTVFIIDDIDKLRNVRGYFNKEHIYPFPIIRESKKILYRKSSLSDFTILDYENGNESYKYVVSKIMLERYGMKRRNPYKKAYLVFFVVGSCLMFVISIILRNSIIAFIGTIFFLILSKSWAKGKQ